MDSINLSNPELYLNRELSLLEFNQRVLLQALNEDLPLLERLAFVFICNRNIDEFFEIRVAGVKQQEMLGANNSSPDGQSPTEVLAAISKSAHDLADEQCRIFNDLLVPLLAKEKIYLLERSQWSEDIRVWLKKYFRQEILPLLTPIALDLAHPFPRLVNKSMNFVVSLQGKDAFGRDSGLAVLQIPRSLPRLIAVPKKLRKNGDAFVHLASIVQEFADDLFPGMTIEGSYAFRLTRNSDLFVDEEQVDDLLKALKGKLFSRRYGDVVRLEVAHDCPEKIVNFLLQKVNLTEDDLYQLTAPVNLSRLSILLDQVDRPDLRFPKLKPGMPKLHNGSKNIFESLNSRDILLYHPYQSFRPVEEFIQQAAVDENVLAIKVTLYRTEADSPMIDCLVEAARGGKEVTVVVELRARFDEAENIELANRLQEAGALVVYGVVGYKTHAKMTLIVRREKNKIRRYAHLGTGNYHSINAQQYADFSLMTGEKEITTDVHFVFQQLTGMGRATKLKQLIHAPFTLHKSLLYMIGREEQHATEGKDAHIIIKVNALTEPKIIQALYQASQAGVKIELIVRGICCLKPGVAGVSDNIKVRSIVGRFLEHARIYYFLNDGEHNTYLASADCMERNLFSRVEVCFPIEDTKLAERVRKEGLQMQLADNSQSWELKSDGSYKQNRPNANQNTKAVQEQLLELLAAGDLSSK